MRRRYEIQKIVPAGNWWGAVSDNLVWMRFSRSNLEASADERNAASDFADTRVANRHTNPFDIHSNAESTHSHSHA